jgi:wyosine [tRNA(Phe)-imidazoG37] synthetase (radical SAM superfamily)
MRRLVVGRLAPFKLLLAEPSGRVIEHPWLLATTRSDESLAPALGHPIPLPEGGRLAHLPGRVPVGADPDSGQLVPLTHFEHQGRRFVPHAVGAVLPPGYTRTLLPGEVKQGGPVLPQWAYTAAAWSPRGPVVWALRTERRTHWRSDRFSTPELRPQIETHFARLPDNAVLRQLKTCALVYRCFTSQNTFYGRDEGAIPASVMCNAACVGCISEQPPSGPPASHQRLEHGPTAEEMAAVGIWHLEHATGRTMISFGQGCEGEPLTRWPVIAEAIRRIRARTRRGSINLNTNGSLTRGLGALLDAGLDAVRISLNSAHPELYAAYYQPRHFAWDDVEASVALARRKQAYLALNLLVFPGVTDREGEVEALCRLVRRYRVDQVQTRPLAIDPLQYVELARGTGAGGAALGVPELLRRLQRAQPGLVVGNFARGLGERGGRGEQTGKAGGLRRPPRRD